MSFVYVKPLAHKWLTLSREGSLAALLFFFIKVNDIASIDARFSILKPFCLGYVSNDKDSEDKTQQNNWYINVYPMEILPNRDGDIMQGEDIEYKNITLGGQDEACKIYKSNCLLGVRLLGLW